jgi:hypothetical protein
MGYDNEEQTQAQLPVSMEVLAKAFSVKRMGGVCLFNLCAAGETLLWEQLPQLAGLLLKLGHYVAIATNCIPTKQLQQLLDAAQGNEYRLFIKCSLQYIELKHRGLIDKFFDNIDLVKSAGASFTVEMITNDESISLIPEIQQVCLARTGALPHIAQARDQSVSTMKRLTQLPLEEHIKTWQNFTSSLFNYQQKHYENKRTEFCHAGDFWADVDLANGIMRQCFGAGKVADLYQAPDEPIRYVAIGYECPSAHCQCAFFVSVFVNAFGEAEWEQNLPTYADERDRVCADGSHWLTPTMLEAFSHRCSEFHKPYSEDKRFYIDLLMRKVYRNLDQTDDESARLAHILKRRLSSVGIIGDNELANWLRKILNIAGIQVKFSVDTSYENVDAVIVTDYTEFGKYAELLRNNRNTIKSITELAD